MFSPHLPWHGIPGPLTEVDAAVLAAALRSFEWPVVTLVAGLDSQAGRYLGWLREEIAYAHGLAGASVLVVEAGDPAAALAALDDALPHLAPEVEACLAVPGGLGFAGLGIAGQDWLAAHPDWWAVELGRNLSRWRRNRVSHRADPPRHAHLPRAGAVPDRVRLSGLADPKHHVTLSVLVPTWRLGGLDCLRAGLDRQTLPLDDLELVLVDAIYDYRANAVARYFADAPYRVVHAADDPIRLPLDAGSRPCNVALGLARGAIALWLCDFTVLDAEAARRHVTNCLVPGRISCGPHVYARPTRAALHPDLRDHLPLDDPDDYVDLIEALPPNSPLWTTIFAAEPLALARAGAFAWDPIDRPYDTPDRVVAATHLVDGWYNPKRYLLNGPMAPDYFYGKNDAGRSEDFRAAGGWPEKFDGGHLYCDTAFARALAERGATFCLDRGCEVVIPNPRGLFPRLRRSRKPSENLKLSEARA